MAMQATVKGVHLAPHAGRRRVSSLRPVNNASLLCKCAHGQRYYKFHLHSRPRSLVVSEYTLAMGWSAGETRREGDVRPPSQLLSRKNAVTLPPHWSTHLLNSRPGERRALERYFPLLARINALEPTMRALDDASLSGLTKTLRSRLSQLSGGDRDMPVPLPITTVTAILPEAFAAIREASYRVLGLRHYDVQLLGGIALSEGRIAEMATGEGKTLVALLPAYLYALTGRGVHVVTVNEYLASRDAAWVGKVLEFMGLTVGVVAKLDSRSACSAFESDVTYLTAYDLAFTFLHDNMIPTVHGVALRRQLHYAIVDEVDSILIDEARNPFIVNAPDAPDTIQAQNAAECWKVAVCIAKSLTGPTPMELAILADAMQDEVIPREQFFHFDFVPDYRYKNATLTQRGMRRVVRMLASSEGKYRVMLARNAEGDFHTVLVSPQGADSTLLTIGNCSTFSKTTMRVDSTRREDIERLLAKETDLCIISPDSANEEMLSSAVPMALWTGIDDNAGANGNAWGRYILTAVRAVHLYKRDVDYVVRNGDVIIVDTSTGRERTRSRWQAGIHQALEAFENVTIRAEDFDRGRVTYQSLFRGYARLCGMTGTAMTEAEEFSEAYGLDVIRIPPHRPSKRVDNKPEVFISRIGWEDRISSLVSRAAAADRPVLLGTSSVEESEQVKAIVASIPFVTRLTEEEVDELKHALKHLANARIESENRMNSLGREITPAEAKSLLETVTSTVSRLLASRRLSPEMGRDVETAVFCVEYLSPSVINDGLKRTLMEVLSEILRRSALGRCRQINVLNARPERARREAETIAQAGLPGTITVATSMAGRGTDILLGGNPRGLAAMALKRTLMRLEKHQHRQDREHSADNNNNDDDEIMRPFESMVFRAFRSPADMAINLPAPLHKAYQDVQSAYVATATEDPWRPWSVVKDVNGVMEIVEKKRSAFLADIRGKMDDASVTLEGATEWVLKKSLKKSTTLEIAVHCYALLLWLWFDGECEKYAAQVRAAGGLAVIITSLQDTRRTELQLRGRAGRQGDPGETYVISSGQDPSLEALLSLAPAQLTQLWSYLESESTPDAVLPAGTVEPMLQRLTRGAEHAGQGAREATRRFDDIVDPLRRHIYRLRRVIVGGGDAARSAIILRALETLNTESAVNSEQGPSIVRDLFHYSSNSSLPHQSPPQSNSIAFTERPMRIVFDVEWSSGTKYDFTVHARVLEEGGSVFHSDGGRVKSGAGLKVPLGIRKRALMAKDRGGVMRDNVFVMAYYRRRNELKQLLQSYDLGNDAVLSNPLQAESIIRLLERDALLACLDDLWADYLQDINTLQRAASTRAFSQFDPFDEFRMEANQTFSRLLYDFKRQAVVAVFAPIDMRLVQHYLKFAFNRDDRVGGLVQDVAWVRQVCRGGNDHLALWTP